MCGGGSSDCVSDDERQCIIKRLLVRGFHSYQFSYKQKIVRDGQPRPELPGLNTKRTVIRKTGKQDYTLHFKTKTYNTYSWMCGCAAATGGLYCWPCLLFNAVKTVRTWKTNGFRDLNNLASDAARHCKLESHLHAVICLANFGPNQNRIETQLDKAREKHIEDHNKKVEKNRAILSRLIKVTIHLAKQEQSFRGHNESKASSNRGNYLETLSLVAEFDPELDEHLKSSNIFKGTSNRIQNELIESITNVVTAEIKDFVNKSPFVSVIVDESTDVSTKSQLCIVLRYFENKNIVERFVTMKDVSEQRDAESLCGVISDVLDQFNVEKDKLTGQGYDGASVMCGVRNGLQAKMKAKYPNAVYIHCLAHRLNLVIVDLLKVRDLSYVRIFFCTLEGLPAYFSTPKRVAALKNYTAGSKLPANCHTRWLYKSKLVNFILKHRLALIKCFEDMANFNLDGFQEYKDVQQAQGFLNFLKKFENMFLLHLFGQIFGRTDMLYSILQKKSLDVVYSMKAVNDSIDYFEDMKIYSFESVWAPTMQCECLDQSEQRTRGFPDHTREQRCKEIMTSVLEEIITSVKTRFENFSQVKFVELVCPEKFSDYTLAAGGFPEEALLSLKNQFSTKFIDADKLKRELTVVYQDVSFRQKDISAIYTYIASDAGLKEAFKETKKLLEIVLCLPSTSVSAERVFSAMRRIKTYLRSTMGEERLSNLSVLSIEKDLLVTMQSANKVIFLNKIIEEYLKKDRRIEFHFK